MQPSSPKKIRTLIIEDDEDDYLLTTDVLSDIEGTSYDVVWFSEAHDPESIFQSGEFDVALVDFQIGEWSGVDLIERAKSLGFQAPLILLTGLQEREVDIAATQAGAADYLCKGQISPQILERSIRYAISTAETRNALLQQSRVMRSTLDNTDTGIGAFNNLSQLIACNTPFLQMLDLSADTENIDGFSIDDPISLGLLSDRVNARMSSATIAESSQALILECGNRIIEMRHSAVADGGSVTLCVDMTERAKNEKILREAKENAEASNREKSAFLANMSHELRTPLNAIIGFSELLRQGSHGPINPPQYVEYVEDIYQSGSDLLSIVNDILDLAKCESGTMNLCISEVPLSEIVNSVVRQVQPLATTAEVVIETDIGDNSIRLSVDESRLRQIVRNLLSNSIKFTPAGGCVRISASFAHNGDLVLAVADNGIGISPDDLPRILEPFQQVDNSLSRKYEGTGLGVPLACAMANLHDGRLEYESELGNGTTANLILPCSRIVASDGSKARSAVA